MEKKLFWLKLVDTFFNETYVKAMRQQKHGDSLTVVYLEMALHSLNTNGQIRYKGYMRSLSEEIALAINEPTERVKATIAALERFRAAELTEDSIILTEIQKLISMESSSAQRMRRLREKKSAEASSQCDGDVTECSVTVTTDIEIDKEKEKELDKELDKDTPKPPAGALSASGEKEIIDEFNSVCPELPRVIQTNSQRTRLISQALNKLGRSGLSELFKKTAASDFLCGRKGGWRASFDWILKPENTQKIIEGSYENSQDRSKAAAEQANLKMLEELGVLAKYRRLNEAPENNGEEDYPF